MFTRAIVSLVATIVAGIFGIFNLAGAASTLFYGAFAVGLVLSVTFLLPSRRPAYATE